MSGELATREDFEELAAEPELEVEKPNAQMVPIPATIVLTENAGGLSLECEAGGTWGYTPFGVFASGKVVGQEYAEDQPEDDWLVPYNAIARVEFDYPAYFAAVAEAQKEQEDEAPSD